jgi:hypothetical protein
VAQPFVANTIGYQNSKRLAFMIGLLVERIKPVKEEAIRPHQQMEIAEQDSEVSYAFVGW